MANDKTALGAFLADVVATPGNGKSLHMLRTLIIVSYQTTGQSAARKLYASIEGAEAEQAPGLAKAVAKAMGVDYEAIALLMTKDLNVFIATPSHDLKRLKKAGPMKEAGPMKAARSLLPGKAKKEQRPKLAKAAAGKEAKNPKKASVKVHRSGAASPAIAAPRKRQMRLSELTRG